MDEYRTNSICSYFISLKFPLYGGIKERKMNHLIEGIPIALHFVYNISRSQYSVTNVGVSSQGNVGAKKVTESDPITPSVHVSPGLSGTFHEMGMI